MNYTTVAQVENYTLKDISASFETQVTDWIEAVSRICDRYTNRTLVAEEAASDKFYDGSGTAMLVVDDAVTITDVEVGDAYGENFSAIADFVKYPAAAPHRRLFRKSGYFERGLQNVKVTGRWGFMGEASADLEFAATVLVAGIINAQKPGAQAKKSERIGEYQVTYTDEKGLADYRRALAILDSYRRHEL